MVESSLPVPISSAVKPCVLVTDPGKVTGIGAAHVLFVVVRVTPVIFLAIGLIAHSRLVEH
jgi:hypothetical protein